MIATASPNPFRVTTGFDVTVTDGTPPYTVEPKTVPPNPPGVTVDPGPPIHVTVPLDTPTDTIVQVVVTDSASPPNQSVAAARVR